MPATQQEIDALQLAYEQAHSALARALSELLVVGNVVLESHGLLERPLGDAFEAFVVKNLQRTVSLGRSSGLPWLRSRNSGSRWASLNDCPSLRGRI